MSTRADGPEEMRRSATRLGDAIIRWGPTLIEDPDSAELLNLLPEIVDSARAAADTISPAADRFDTGRATEPFGETLREILDHADEFSATGVLSNAIVSILYLAPSDRIGASLRKPQVVQ